MSEDSRSRSDDAELDRKIESTARYRVESLRWALTPANKNETVGVLAEHLKLPLDIAEKSYVDALDPLAPDARFDAGSGHTGTLASQEGGTDG